MISPNCKKTLHVSKNIWKMINTSSLLLTIKNYVQIFVLQHYLLLEAHSFPWASFSENCSLLRTGNAHALISSEHIFMPNGSNFLFIYKFAFIIEKLLTAYTGYSTSWNFNLFQGKHEQRTPMLKLFSEDAMSVMLSAAQ